MALHRPTRDHLPYVGRRFGSHRRRLRCESILLLPGIANPIMYCWSISSLGGWVSPPPTAACRAEREEDGVFPSSAISSDPELESPDAAYLSVRHCFRIRPDEHPASSPSRGNDITVKQDVGSLISCSWRSPSRGARRSRPSPRFSRWKICRLGASRRSDVLSRFLWLALPSTQRRGGKPLSVVTSAV